MLTQNHCAPTGAIAAAAIMMIAASGFAPTGCLARDATSNAFLEPAEPKPGDSGPATHPYIFEAIPPGTLLRLQLGDTRILEGPFGGVSGGTFRFDDVKSTTVEFSQVRAAWRRSSGASKGLALGAVLGAGAAIWSLAELGCPPPVYFVGFSIGSIGGGLFGAGVGAAFPTWEPLELR